MAETDPPAPAQHHHQGSIFSRRPSFFGGRHRLPKTPTSSQLPTVVQAKPSPSPPPTLKPPIFISPIGSAEALLGQSNHPSQYEPASKEPSGSSLSTPPRRKHASSRHSISSTLGDLGTTLQRSRSASIRTNDSSGNASSISQTSSHRRTPSATLALSLSPEKNPPLPNGAPPQTRPALSISTFSRSSKQKSAESVRPGDAASRQGYDKAPLSAVDNPKTPFAGMAIPLRYPTAQKENQQNRRQESGNMNYNAAGLGPAAPIAMPSGSNPNVIFQHIQEMASKRISTLDYLRKACVFSPTSLLPQQNH